MTNQGTNLDPWYDSYADRTAGLSASEVRALFAVASRPEVVSLAGGMPFVSALPKEMVMGSIEKVMRDNGAMALQYGSGQGTPAIREHIMEIMAMEGIRGSADNVVVTTGSQQALDLVTRLFINPGDVVLAESPSYVGALGVFRAYQADVVHVEMDDEGLDPEALRQAITALEAAGKPIKFLYTIPNFHNPAGVTLTWARRLEILDICRSHGILVLEDNPYGLLYFDQPAPQAMRSVDDEGVIYLGSFSKTLAPGFRVGWALAPHAIREKLILANESATLSPSSFGQFVITEYLDQTDWKGQIDTFRGIYAERRDAMLSALGEYLPSLSWTKPDGGFFVWVTLPDELDAKAMLPRAVKELVAYTPGTAFFSDGQGRNNIRLSFCYPTPESIRLGVSRLATVINGELDLLRTFSGASMTTQTPTRQSVGNPPPNTL
ncbi:MULTISPECIES: PLP-dependent aminotransferase family protein [unclassified Frondihabitans]|uniref:aminotransferase-like domain-containing protein n=1 Tax=unclassified Frondihabitans TaxID=2626248 RepID=UPI000F4FAAF9|nr:MULTISPECIES: PLP-dependent aminotransferase family protein [unclassified Frondihabitans]RPE77779.1 DNA-binding transcriptional MocR family regulator [Frondihabitans sp. PhB153]RPF08058.1 DNA-binding transcriptional MocR family regulator [Frondihabitans sp. PhB161]